MVYLLEAVRQSQDNRKSAVGVCDEVPGFKMNGFRAQSCFCRLGAIALSL